jgi:hypothetical protein
MEQIEKIKEQFEHFLVLGKDFVATAKELDYDPVALYAKEPLMMEVSAGVVVFLLFVVILIIKSKVRHAGANRALQNLENYIENFDEYQTHLQKITKILKGAKGDFLTSLQTNKEKIYNEQLRTLEDLPLEEKIDKYQEMATLYRELANTTKDEELSDFYEEKVEEILNEVLYKDIKEYMKTFSFTPEDVVVLEKIVAYANTQEDSQNILSLVTQKLEHEDFGSNLEIYTFVKNLDPETLGDLYDYCKEQQEKLFESGERVVAPEVLEYLLENGEQEKVFAYIKALKVPTHLQELYYRFFDQKGIQELDFAFIANPLEITHDYVNYLESLITDKWRDADALDTVLSYDKLEKYIGHDRVRQVIERIDALRKTFDEEKTLKEALELAQEAHRIALETKTLIDLKEKAPQNNGEQEETLKQETPKEV